MIYKKLVACKVSYYNILNLMKYEYSFDLKNKKNEFGKTIYCFRFATP